MPRSSFDGEAIEAEIDRIRSLGLDELRSLWHATFRTAPPPGFTKDLIARFLCWHVQEQVFGGLDPKTAKHLAGLARGDWSRVDRPRRLKPGTVLVREYQGERHTVTVVANGFVWREATYLSLSTKSSEHNLDLEFNSLDAQREACEAYIKSQAHEGWNSLCSFVIFRYIL
jgi:Protein of unknown function (DUF2924)